MPLPTNPTLSDVVTALRFCEAAILTINKRMEEVMPCGVTTTTCAAPVNNLLFECCDRLKSRAYKCEAPTGCDGATFPVGLQINVNEWPTMGDYPVYALKLFDCVGGKAQVGLLGAVNGSVKTGIDIKIPNTAAAAALKLTIVDPITGAVIEGQEINIGLAPATDTDGVSGSGTTSPGLVLDSGVTITGPFEAVIGTPNRNAFLSFWEGDVAAEDPGILITTEQRSWLAPGTTTRIETGFTVMKTKETDGFAMSVIDKPSLTCTFFAGTVPDSDIAAGVLTRTVATGVAAATYSLLTDSAQNQIDGSAAALSMRDDSGNIWAGVFLGNILVQGDATLVGAAFGGWADYVLEPDYALMPLDKLSAYIEEFKHLPDVPTAEMVSSSGLSIGNTFKTLLLKIEELTLYTLQLNERIAELEG